MRESKTKKLERMNSILTVLQKQYPDALCALHYSTPFQLLIATILSAQCTDARVNMVTPHLFAEYPDAETMQKADINHLEEIIHSTGFYKAKAKNILACSQMIMNVYNGELPLDIDALILLPGVGRKTANVLLGNAFGINAGITVDTHVTRIMNALKFVKTTDAVKIEQELMPLVPQNDWTVFTHRIIEHGRAVCIARRPRCNECVISEYCPSASM
ncbi:MAG: endonuclease III [Ignavibacteriae bacterium]|jgi:endonuclease-3|nr:endonuclease III [Ignavibacteriota bacterium]